MRTGLVLVAAILLIVGAGCAEDPKLDARGRVSTQQIVGVPETVEVEITNNDSKTFSGLALEFQEATAWTIQDVRPNGEPLGDNTYRLGSIAPGETVHAEATLVPHTAGNWTLTMNVIGDARSNGIKLDYAGTIDFDIAVLP